MSDMTKHSPGPWRFENLDGEAVPFDWCSGRFYNNPSVVDANGNHVVGCGEYLVFEGHDDAQRAANVALIVSAPEMHAELDRIRRELVEVRERLTEAEQLLSACYSPVRRIAEGGSRTREDLERAEETFRWLKRYLKPQAMPVKDKP
jgi:hypothetical protein